MEKIKPWSGMEVWSCDAAGRRAARGLRDIIRSDTVKLRLQGPRHSREPQVLAYGAKWHLRQLKRRTVERSAANLRTSSDICTANPWFPW